MKHLLSKRIALSLLCLVWSAMSWADVVVVAHPDSPIRAMTARQVSDLYLGRSRTLELGKSGESAAVLIYEHPTDSAVREAFFRSLNGMGLRQVNAYWARLRFSGEILPPMSLSDSHAVLNAVARNRNAIGYVDSSLVNDSVKVVLRLKEWLPHE